MKKTEARVDKKKKNNRTEVREERKKSLEDKKE